MNILFIISELTLTITFILKKKTEKSLDIINFLCLSIILLFSYNTLVCYVLTFFTILCKLWILSTINFLVTIFLIIPMINKKEIQSYKFNKIDVLYIFLIIIILVAISYNFFGYPIDINYASADPAMHYLTSIRFAEQETLMPNTQPDDVYGKMSTRKPMSYVNSGLLMKMFSKNLEPISCYNIFVYFDLLTLILIGITMYTALKKYANNKEQGFWAFLITVICILGYPINSFLFGFEYLTMALLILVSILDFIYTFENDELKFSYIVLIFSLLNFGLFCSYYMFVPFVYSALWIYFYINNNKKHKKRLTKELIIIWMVTLIIPFVLGYIYHLEPKFYSVIIDSISKTEAQTNSNYSSYVLNTGLKATGFVYKNLYSNMILLLPLPIYLFIRESKIKKLKNNSFFALILLLVVLFMEILLMGNANGKVSLYYLAKNYFALWIILGFVNYKALIYIYEKDAKYFSRLFIVAYVVLMVICTVFSNVAIKEAGMNEDENLLSVMEIFGANKAIMLYKKSDYNQNELEIIKYAKANLDFSTRIELIADHRTYYWAYPLLRYTDKDEVFYTSTYGEQAELGRKWANLQKKVTNENELDYIIYFNRSKLYKRVKNVLFENSEIVYENEAGGILKYNNKRR